MLKKVEFALGNNKADKTIVIIANNVKRRLSNEKVNGSPRNYISLIYV